MVEHTCYFCGRDSDKEDEHTFEDITFRDEDGSINRVKICHECREKVDQFLRNLEEENRHQD